MDSVLQSRYTTSKTRKRKSRLATPRKIVTKSPPRRIFPEQQNTYKEKKYDQIAGLNFRVIKRSSIFWNSLLIIPISVIAFTNLYGLLFGLAAGSAFSLGIILDRNKRCRLWMLWMPGTWLIMGLYGLMCLVRKAEAKLIAFNNFLDGK